MERFRKRERERERERSRKKERNKEREIQIEGKRERDGERKKGRLKLQEGGYKVVMYESRRFKWKKKMPDNDRIETKYLLID